MMEQTLIVEATSSAKTFLEQMGPIFGPILGTIAGVWIASIFAKKNLKISQEHEIRLSKENRKTQFELSLLEKRFDAINE